MAKGRVWVQGARVSLFGQSAGGVFCVLAVCGSCWGWVVGRGESWRGVCGVGVGVAGAEVGLSMGVIWSVGSTS